MHYLSFSIDYINELFVDFKDGIAEENGLWLTFKISKFDGKPELISDFGALPFIQNDQNFKIENVL